MATLYIAEFGNIAAYPGTDSAQIAKVPALALQTRAITSTSSTSSAAFNANTQIVRLVTDTQCWVTFGAIGTTVATANATAIYLPANVPEYFGVLQNYTSGTTAVVAVLSST